MGWPADLAHADAEWSLDGVRADDEWAARVRLRRRRHALGARSPRPDELRRLRHQEFDHLGGFVIRPLALAVCATLLSRVILAQRVESSVDLSGTNVWYADSIRSGGASVNPAVRVDWSRATLNGAASVSRLAGGQLSTQAVIAPSVFTPSLGRLALELAGSLGGSTHADGSRTGQGIGLARAHAIAGRAGAWIGGGVGRTWDGVIWRGVRQGDAGAWLERAGMTTVATVAPVIVQDTIRYTDVQASWRYPVGAYELGATAGVRAGETGAAVGGSSRTWASVSAVAWFARGLAIVASGGSYPIDFTQGYPGGHFVSVALRIASRDGRPAARAETATRDRPAAATSFEVRATGTTKELRFYASAARSVEISGDFTRWQPLALQRGGDGWWSTAMAIAPGTYQMNLRVDGGPWLAPPGLLATRDEFGGIVGILTIQ